jgi:hypothetical protein
MYKNVLYSDFLFPELCIQTICGFTILVILTEMTAFPDLYGNAFERYQQRNWTIPRRRLCWCPFSQAHGAFTVHVSPGIEPGCVIFPSQNNNDMLCSSSILQIHVEIGKFLAVRRVGLMTHHEYRVDRPFPVT